jgi:hypothetical protein
MIPIFDVLGLGKVTEKGNKVVTAKGWGESHGKTWPNG